MKIEINILSKDMHITCNSERVTFSEGIKAILTERNWSREDVAYYLRVSKRTVDGWINGRKPSNATLILLHYMMK